MTEAFYEFMISERFSDFNDYFCASRNNLYKYSSTKFEVTLDYFYYQTGSKMDINTNKDDLLKIFNQYNIELNNKRLNNKTSSKNTKKLLYEHDNPLLDTLYVDTSESVLDSEDYQTIDSGRKRKYNISTVEDGVPFMYMVYVDDKSEDDSNYEDYTIDVDDTLESNDTDVSDIE